LRGDIFQREQDRSGLGAGCSIGYGDQTAGTSWGSSGGSGAGLSFCSRHIS
jgi:hypothetical protein